MWCIDVCLLSANCTVPDTSAPHTAEQSAICSIDPAPRLLWHRIIITCYWVTVLPCGRCMYTACRSCRSVPTHSTRIPCRSEQNYWRCRWNFAVIFTIFRAVSNLAKYLIAELNSVRLRCGVRTKETLFSPAMAAVHVTFDYHLYWCKSLNVTFSWQIFVPWLNAESNLMVIEVPSCWNIVFC